MFTLLRWIGILILFVVATAGALLYNFHEEQERREVRSAQELAPKTGHFVKAADIRLFVQEAGPASGPAVVFINGPGLWSESWHQPMTKLGSLGYHAIAIDLPPFGFSDRPDAATYSKRDQAMRILGLLDSLSISNAVLVGHSFGAAPTVEAAIVAPQRVRALVLVDAVLDIRSRRGIWQTQQSDIVDFLIQWPRVRELLVGSFITNPTFTRQLLSLAVIDSSKATRSWVTQLQAPLGVKGTTEAVNDWLPTLLVDDQPAFSEFRWSYPWLKMPMVLMWGKLDEVTRMEDAERIHGLAKQSRLIVLDNAGHLPQIEDADAFSQQLADAMKALVPPKAAQTP